MRPQQCASACTITSTVMLLRTCSQKCPSGFYIYHPQHSERYCNANNYRWLSYNLPDNLPDEASPWGGGDWLSLWSQIDYSSLWNHSSFKCSFSRRRLKQINDDAQTVSLSSLFQVLMTRSLKKCCLKSVLTRFLFSFNEWPLVQLQDENLKKVSNYDSMTGNSCKLLVERCT